MRDIDQFRQLIKGNTDTINTDQIIPKAPPKELKRWTGIVVNNDDPDKLGRVQIKIYGFYDNFEFVNIPWAVPDINSLTSTAGTFIIPELNSIVRGYFDNGDELKPVYDSLAFNSGYVTKENNIQEWLMRTDDYPHTMVLFRTDQKDFLVMNRKTGEMAFTHHTGSVMRVDPDGNIEIGTSVYSAGPANLNISVSGNTTIKSNGMTVVSGRTGVQVKAGKVGDIELGNNSAKQPVNNLKTCLICGAPHCIGNFQVKA